MHAGCIFLQRPIFCLFCRDTLKALRDSIRSNQIRFAEQLRCKPAYISIFLNGKADFSNEQGAHGAKDRCAKFLCINSGYSQGDFVSDTNDMCNSSLTSSSIYYIDYLTGAVQNGTTTNEVSMTSSQIYYVDYLDGKVTNGNPTNEGFLTADCQVRFSEPVTIPYARNPILSGGCSLITVKLSQRLR